ncbi:MAG TPA: glycosyltransferase family 9 protein, partial [Gemmatimonadaceae bacterium]|nr:glycosyltransferase family 9 protein [Gemmatimonadaceae bacterium]
GPRPLAPGPRSTASLVIQTSFIGDAVLTTGLLSELARRGPVDVVVTPAAAPLLANHPAIRERFVYDKRGGDAGAAGLLRLARRIRRHYRERGERATAYLAQSSARSAALALLAGIGERVGFAGAPGRALYTRRVPRRTDRHHAERLWRLAFAGAPAAEPAPEAFRPTLFPGPAERAAVDALLGAGDAARPLVVLAPGSVWGTKRWPYYPELAARLAPHARLAVVGGPADGEHAREIMAAAPSAGIVDATGRLSLLGSAELIGRAALLVTNDSSPQHLASAMGTPTITLFGPTVPAFGFGPLAPDSLSLGHEHLECRPCHHHGPPACPLGHWRCMRELDVERVAVAAAGVLGVKRGVPADR